MESLLDDVDLVDVGLDDFMPTPEDLEWLALQDDEPAATPPPSEPRLPMAEWVRAEASWLRSHDDGLLTICACELELLASAIEMHRPRTVADLVNNAFARPFGLDLSRIEIPASRISPLAARVDEEARRLLAVGSDLAAVAAWYLLRQANDFERYRSQRLCDYLIDEAAFRAACEDACFPM